MGRTSPNGSPAILDYGTPAFMASKSTLLLAYWLKMGAAGYDAVFSTDFSTKGWWIPYAGGDVYVSVYPTPTNRLMATSVVGAGWIPVGVLFTAGGLITYMNGAQKANVAASDTPLGSLTLQAGVELADNHIAEIGIWKDGSLDNTMADAIMAKLANAAGAQRRAIDISDQAAAFYAPLLPGGSNTDLVAGVTASASNVIDGDHPWAVGGSEGAARHYYSQLMRA